VDGVGGCESQSFSLSVEEQEDSNCVPRIESQWNGSGSKKITAALSTGVRSPVQSDSSSEAPWAEAIGVGM
jgi:hypothetical protein